MINQKASQVSNGVEELVYRSNLIGTDRAVCNWGGDNTSMKTTEKDFRGRDIEVMWVKGSGSKFFSNQNIFPHNIITNYLFIIDIMQ